MYYIYITVSCKNIEAVPMTLDGIHLPGRRDKARLPGLVTDAFAVGIACQSSIIPGGWGAGRESIRKFVLEQSQ